MGRDRFVWEVQVRHEVLDDEMERLREVPYALWQDVTRIPLSKLVTARGQQAVQSVGNGGAPAGRVGRYLYFAHARAGHDAAARPAAAGLHHQLEQTRSTSLSVLQHRANVLPLQLVASVQRDQLDQHDDAVHLASELPYQIDGRVRQLADLAHRHEARADAIGDRGAENESAALDPDDERDAGAVIWLRHGVDRQLEPFRVPEQRRDVVEQDAGLGEVRHVTNASLE